MKVETMFVEESKVVSAYGFGRQPEQQAGEVLRAFLETVGWGKVELRRRRLFGFNNPNPEPGSDKYGYELWITVAPEFRLPGRHPDTISLRELPGGLYASLRSFGTPDPEKWGGVVRWIHGSEYQYDASRQWFEEVILDGASMPELLGQVPEHEERVSQAGC